VNQNDAPRIDYDAECAICVMTLVDPTEDVPYRFLPIMLEVVNDLQISLGDDKDKEPFQQLPSIIGDQMEAVCPKAEIDKDNLR
jgi:hypothetical protein